MKIRMLLALFKKGTIVIEKKNNTINVMAPMETIHSIQATATKFFQVAYNLH